MNHLGHLPYLNKIHIQVIFALIFFAFAKGQDPVMSQTQIAKNYINPAFAGYSNDFSLSYNTRLQWTRIDGVEGRYNTNYFAANVACQSAKMGFAVYGYDNVEGSGFLRTTMAGVQAAYYSSFNNFSKGRRLRKSKSAFSAGLQIGLGQKFLDWKKLTFSDQLSNSNYQIVRPNSIVSPQNQSSNIIWDLATGFRVLSSVVINRKEGYWTFGASAYHIARNQESFFGFDNNLWPTRYVAHASFNYPWWLKKRSGQLFDVSLLINRQGSNNSITLLTNYSYRKILKGGMGFKTGGVNPDAVLFQYQMRVNDDWLISYNYEYTISPINQSRTFGTHELGLIYVFKNSSICGDKVEECFGPTNQIRSERLWSL